MKIIKQLLILLILILLMVSVTGCWDNRDLTELAIGTAIGFDKADGGDIQVTIQIVKPGAIGAKTQGKEDPVWVYSTSGETVFSAVRNLLATVNRKTYFGHIQLVVVSEEIAREGIIDVLDLFERDAETNRQADILITKGLTAKQVLEAQSELEDIPAMHIVDIIENNSDLAKIKDVEIFELLQCLSAPCFSPTIGVIKSVKKDKKNLEIKNLKVKGTAVFKKDRLVGWLDSFETRGLLFVEGKVQSGIINITNPFNKDKKIAFEIVGASGERDVKFIKGEPTLIVKVKATGRIGSQQGKGDFFNPERVKKLNSKVEQVIEQNIKEVIKVAQNQYQSDFFDFAGIVHRKYLDYWHQINGEEEWDQVFSHLPVKIEVNWRTESTGLITSPTEAN